MMLQASKNMPPTFCDIALEDCASHVNNPRCNHTVCGTKRGCHKPCRTCFIFHVRLPMQGQCVRVKWWKKKSVYELTKASEGAQHATSRSQQTFRLPIQHLIPMCFRITFSYSMWIRFTGVFLRKQDTNVFSTFRIYEYPTPYSFSGVLYSNTPRVFERVHSHFVQVVPWARPINTIRHSNDWAKQFPIWLGKRLSWNHTWQRLGCMFSNAAGTNHSLAIFCFLTSGNRELSILNAQFWIQQSHQPFDQQYQHFLVTCNMSSIVKLFINAVGRR